MSKTFTFYCALDKAIPSVCKTGVKLTGLTSGVHALAVYAADQAGNASKAVSLRWTVTP